MNNGRAGVVVPMPAAANFATFLPLLSFADESWVQQNANSAMGRRPETEEK
jgi:hypothetical protein